MQTRWIAGWLAVAMGGAQGVAKQQTMDQPQPVKLHAVLVELFTSEGCSSCPPADDLLRRVDGKKTDQGALIVGISEHVTYWDHDGWKDPYGSETITDRQSEYSRRFHLESVYTPQMVVDGEAQFVGSDARSLAQAIRKVQGETETTLQIRSVTVDGSWVAAQVSVGTMPSKGAEVFAVVAEDETTQHVLRGENEGKTLAHASVARVMVRIAQLRTGETTGLRVKLPDDTSMPRNAKRHLIVWAQEPNFGRVLGIDTQAF